MIPELPDIGLVERSKGDWLQSYIDYAVKKSPMTPTLFHESAGLWLLSVVIARRIVLKMDFEDIYTNLFICWIAPTTLYHKTTALNVARKIAIESFSHLLAPQDMTPEAFLSDMAGREPTNMDQLSDKDRELWKKERDFCSQRGLVMDEMSGLLASTGKDYNAGLLENFLRFYNCDEETKRSTRGQGRIVVRDSYLTMVGASTPAAMSTHLKNEFLWSNGWWPRFALLTPDKEPEWIETVDAKEPGCIRKKLHFIYDELPQPKWPDKPKAIQTILGNGTFELWNRYNKLVQHDMIVSGAVDNKLSGTYGRSQIQALKVAMLLAACEFDGKRLVITKTHVNDGICVAESWRMSAHRVLDVIEETEFNKTEMWILGICAAKPEGVSLRDIHSEIRSQTPVELQLVLDQMEKMEMVEKFYDNHGGKVGRPTTKYRIKSS